MIIVYSHYRVEVIAEAININHEVNLHINFAYNLAYQLPLNCFEYKSLTCIVLCNLNLS